MCSSGRRGKISRPERENGRRQNIGVAGKGNPDGSLHDATTFGEGHLTKHVPSFGV